MSNRRSRASRSRKATASVAPPPDAAPDMSVSAVHPVARERDPNAPSPTETAQLRALEAGWDELLS